MSGLRRLLQAQKKILQGTHTMFTKRICLLAVGIMSATQAVASQQSESNGFVQDSSLNVLLRNAYINRDYKNTTRNDSAEWGQAAIGTFSSGFTQGTVGVGVDAFGLYALRLDGGSGRSGNGGIDFFKQDSNGNAAHDLSRMGAAVKFRVSNTVLKYGDMMPELPVLQYDDSRLLPESFTGTMITSKEIDGLEINAGHFTEEARKSAEGRDSGGLKAIDVLGGSYKITKDFKASLYGMDVKNVYKQQYLGMNYVRPLSETQSLILDFQGYRTNMDREFAATQGGDTNRIWSLAATFNNGPHAFTLAHQRSSGNTGYPYGGYQNNGGVGNGGNSIYLANSYWSDFNGEDETSWQLGYGLDFATFGVPGLSYKFAYVRGSNIETNGQGDGTEREIFNQVQYVVQSGPAKDLKLRARSSILRVSNNAAAYNTSGNEVRLFVEYPISIF
jgi:hypothetical protein